jgi:hypothetical protein
LTIRLQIGESISSWKSISSGTSTFGSASTLAGLPAVEVDEEIT